VRALSLRALGELARHVRLPREELSIVPVQEVSQYPLLRLVDFDELHSKLFPLRPADDPELDRHWNDFLDHLARLLARKWCAMSPDERAAAGNHSR